MSKNKVKIESVRIEHKPDNDGDTSHLGEYTNQPKGWYLDRETGELKDDAGEVLATNVPCDSPGRGEYRYITSFQYTVDSWAHVSDKEVAASFLHIRYRANGHEQNLHGNLFEKFGVLGYQRATTRESKIKVISIVYCCLDCARLYAYERNDWSYIGIIAKANIHVGDTCQVIRSGGLWGVESDSGEKYFNEVAQDELADLRDQLSALGLGKRAIDFAFKSIETKTL